MATTMTLAAFLTHLAACRERFAWIVDTRGCICGLLPDGRCGCPLTATDYAITGVLLSLRDADLAAGRLGLSDDDGADVQDAADHTAKGDRILTLRASLLAAVGLDQVGGASDP